MALYSVQWILGHSLGYGVGIGLPFLWADLGGSRETFSIVFTMTFLLLGYGIGLIQQLTLCRVLPISKQWSVAVGFMPLLSIPLYTMLSFLGPLAFLAVPIIYPLILTLTQWVLLRRIVRPAWRWIVFSLGAIALSFVCSSIIATAIRVVAAASLGTSITIGALIYGGTYGAITYLGLLHLINRSQKLPVSANQSADLVSSDSSASQMVALSTGLLIGLAVIWTVMLPPLSPAVMTQLRTIPLGLPLGGGLIILLVAVGYLCLMILGHELGHLLLALMHGFEIRAFAVSRWVLIRHGKKWRLCHTQKRFAGGFVLPVPKSVETFDKRSLKMMLWGGVLATFLIFLAGVLPVFLWPSTVSSSLFLWSLAALSLLSFHSTILNILPLTIGHLRTDGRRLLDLANDDLPGQSFFALYSIDASLRQGIRPSEINPALIERVLSAPKNSMVRVDGLYTAYIVAMDKGELEKAGHYLDQALENQAYMPELFRGKSFLEGAYFEAFIRGRADVARQWFEKVQDTVFIPPAALCRVEAALLLSDGKREAALKKAEQGMVSVECDRFMKGTAVAEEDFLQDLIQKIRAS